MKKVDITAKQATLHQARAFLIMFTTAFYHQGWMPAVHGSSVEKGEGRDVDIILVRLDNPPAISEDAIVSELKKMGMNIVIDEQRDRFRGIVGTFGGFAVDITLVR